MLAPPPWPIKSPPPLKSKFRPCIEVFWVTRPSVKQAQIICLAKPEVKQQLIHGTTLCVVDSITHIWSSQEDSARSQLGRAELSPRKQNIFSNSLFLKMILLFHFLLFYSFLCVRRVWSPVYLSSIYGAALIGFFCCATAVGCKSASQSAEMGKIRVGRSVGVGGGEVTRGGQRFMFAGGNVTLGACQRGSSGSSITCSPDVLLLLFHTSLLTTWRSEHIAHRNTAAPARGGGGGSASASRNSSQGHWRLEDKNRLRPAGRGSTPASGRQRWKILLCVNRISGDNYSHTS